MQKAKRYLPDFLFICYLAVLLRITVFRGDFGANPLFGGAVYFSLFTDYIEMLAAGKWRSFLYLFFGNIGWFVPFGFYMRRRLHRSCPQTLALGLLLSLCIESLQFIFSTGLSEADDLILNTGGAWLGWLLEKCAPHGKN